MLGCLQWKTIAHGAALPRLSGGDVKYDATRHRQFEVQILASCSEDCLHQKLLLCSSLLKPVLDYLHAQI